MAENFLQQLLAADLAEKAALVARSVLAGEESVLTNLVPVLAFLRWFDEPVMAALLPQTEQPRSTTLFARLTSLPFVEPVAYGYALHDLTRQGLLATARVEDRLEATRSADIYAAKRNEGGLLEAFYCTVLREDGEAARRFLDFQIDQLARAENSAGFASIFAALKEAETLVGHPIVERTSLHWVAQGLASSDNGDYLAAIADYDRAISLTPEYADAYYNRGLAYRSLGDYTNAIADYDRAIQLNPQFAEAYSKRGNVYRALGKYSFALADYDRAINLSPNYVSASNNRGTLLRLLGRIEEAYVDYRQAVDLRPTSYIGWFCLADLSRFIGDEDGWRIAIETARPLLDKRDIYNAACFYSIAGEIARSLEFLLLAITERPGMADWAKQDPHLAWIQDDPRFWEIVGDERGGDGENL